MSAMLDAALDYAARGWPVFPIAPRTKKPLGRLVPRGLLDATTELATIERWWGDTPTANVGITTGAASFDVLDVDDDAATDWLYEQSDAAGVDLIESTGYGPRAITSRGYQLMFRPTGRGNATHLRGQAIDFRGAGGYVVAPPSIHPDGPIYAWPEGFGPDAALEPMPEWLVAALWPPRVAEVSQRENHGSHVTGDAYGRRALEAEVARLAMAADGARNDELNRSAFSLGQLVGAGKLDATDVANTLVTVGLRIGLGATEVERTVSSGLRSGMASPRKVATR